MYRLSLSFIQNGISPQRDHLALAVAGIDPHNRDLVSGSDVIAEGKIGLGQATGRDKRLDVSVERSIASIRERPNKLQRGRTAL